MLPQMLHSLRLLSLAPKCLRPINQSVNPAFLSICHTKNSNIRFLSFAGQSSDQPSSSSAESEERPAQDTPKKHPKRALSDIKMIEIKEQHNIKPAADLSDHRRGSDVVSDGIIGDKVWEWEELKDEASFFPKVETYKMLFNGTKFEDIPICHLWATKNNTKIYFYTASYDFITATSASREGFKNAKKKTEVAGQTTGIAAGLRALRRDVKQIRVVLHGLGPGRFSAINGLKMAGLEIVSISDVTIVPETTKKPRSVRRV